MKKKLPSILKEIKTKVLPEIDYATQKSISYSQMSMFNECPKKWSLQYREGHKQFTSSIHTVFGTALHEVLQQKDYTDKLSYPYRTVHFYYP